MSTSSGGGLNNLTAFLNNGQATPVTLGNQATTQMPSWYTNYAQGILSGAQNYAHQGAPIFPGPQVAPQTAETQQSYQDINKLAGTYGGLATQGANTVGNAVQGIQSGGALAAANPYLQGAAAPTSSTVQNYLNPFMQDVTNQIATQGQLALQNNLLPALNNSFVSSGGGAHYGGTDPNNPTQGNQGVGNTQESYQQSLLGNQVAQSIAAQQAQALQQGYGTALQGATSEAGILGGLANTAGGLSATNTGQQLGAGTALANIGAMGENTGLAQAGAENAAGQQQQQQTQNSLNAAMQNYMTQFNWPLQGTTAMEGALQYATPAAGQQTTQYQQVLPNQQTQLTPSPFNTALGAFGANPGSTLGSIWNSLQGGGGNNTPYTTPDMSNIGALNGMDTTGMGNTGYNQISPNTYFGNTSQEQLPSYFQGAGSYTGYNGQ